MQAVVNAVGALCLNQPGLDQLSAKPTVVPGIFAIFVSERHVKVLQDRENAVLIGSAIDELIRHHPSLKTPVFDAIIDTLQKIETLGNSFNEPLGSEGLYRLQLVKKTEASVTDPNPSSADPGPAGPSTEPLITDSLDANTDEQVVPEQPESVVVSFVDVIGRVRVPKIFRSVLLLTSLGSVPGRLLSAHPALPRFYLQDGRVGATCSHLCPPFHAI